jgi:vacuolar protein sorting-associated protein 26
MDGSPSRGETIPIRLFLGGFDLTPTFREVNKKYSTRYYLSLVLIDEGTLPLPLCAPRPPRCARVFNVVNHPPADARRYFKQSEIVLYRQQPEIAAAAGQQTQITGAPPPERSLVAPQPAEVAA